MTLSPVPLLLLVSLTAATQGCGGRIDAGEDYTGNPGDSTAAGPSSHGPSFSAQEVAAARAQCDAPHGPVDPYSTVSELTSRLSGSWLECFTPQATYAIEYLSDVSPVPCGHPEKCFSAGYYGLTWDPLASNGGPHGLSRGAMETMRIVDEGAPTGPGATPFVVTADTEFSPTFEQSPRRLQKGTRWWVALGQ
jgi:hypothetical protein